MRVAVTGAGGFLGLNLVRELIAHGHDVLAVDRAFSAKARAVLEKRPGLRFEAVDVLQRPALDVLFGGYKPEALFHGATLTADITRERSAFADILAVNVAGTGNVLEAAAKAGTGRIIVASSSAVYGDGVFAAPPRETDPVSPVTLYGISKLAAEQAALRFADIHGEDVVALRIAAVFGSYEYRSGARDAMSPLFQIAEKAIRGEAVSLPAGGERDWIAAGRVAAIIRAMIESPRPGHRLYNVAGPECWSPKLLCQALAGGDIGLRQAPPGTSANIDYRDDLSRRRFALSTERLRAEFGEAIVGEPAADCREFAGWIAANRQWFQDNV